MNIFSVLSLYPLVIWSGGNRWSGVVAAMVAGLLSPMPIQYINWGRYTQLTGQVILPVAVVISGIFLQARHLKLSIAIVSSIVIAGLAFTHYRILIFYVIFTGVWIVLNVRKDNGLHQIKRLLIIGFGAASLFFMVLAYFLWLHYAKFYSKTNDRPRKGFRIYSPVQYD
jgi:glucan phosphoethanolaminetransferase (alkaline phosphatase superfamily)